MPEPLPPNPFTADSPECNLAYLRCLSWQNRATPNRLPDGGVSELVCARVLGYLLLYAPTQTGRLNIANEINDGINDSKLIEVAQFYINHFIRCFKRTKGPTPAPSDHPSRPSFDNIKDTFLHLMQELPSDHSTAKYQALHRDRYRCALSGKLGTMAVQTGFVSISAEHRVTSTQAAHIFPPWTNTNIDEGSDKHAYSGSVWAVMERFGGVNAFLELNGDRIHRLENIITMSSDIHFFFDNLMMWLEPTVNGEPNNYRVRAIPAFPNILHETLPVVTFQSNPPLHPAPDPRYIALHAACAKVAHMSGAAEHIDKVVREMEETRVLADDGSSAEVLARVLQLCAATA